MLRYDTVIFDLDGTLTNSEKGITACAAYALEALRMVESIVTDAAGQDGQLIDFLLGAYYRQALLCCESGQPEEAAAVLEKGYQALASFEERHDDGKRHDFLYPIMPRRTKKEAAAQYLGFLRDERFACLHELPGFQMVQTGVGKIVEES